MKILFINPPNVPITSKNISIEPIDVLTIASFTGNLGYEVDVFDMDREDIQKDELKERLINISYDIVIIIHDYHIPLFQDKSYNILSEIIQIIKNFNIKVIVGGKLVTYAPKQLLLNNIYPDVVISKEMELPIRELLKNTNWNKSFLLSIPNIIFRFGDSIIETEKIESNFNINALPIPNRDLVNIDNYIDVRTILSSRGCSFKCSFCSVPDFWGKRRIRSPQNVVNEIKYLSEKFGARKILFLDDNATIENDRMREISQLLIKLKLNVSLGCLGNLLHFDETTMKLMYEAGFRWIHYGVESGSDTILKSINKYIPKEKIMNIIENTRNIGFRVRTSWIMDLPGSTAESIEETTKFIMDIQSEEIRIHYLSLRFGSHLFHQFKKTSDLLPDQYIHRKLLVDKSPISDKILSSIDNLTRTLENKDYYVINNLDDNNIFNTVSKSDTKIISFCPLKYGIGWI